MSDNASDVPYALAPADVVGLQVRLLRSDRPLSVTENWNRALGAASGRYVLMLGDDDALAPGALAAIRQTIETFEAPDIVYVKCFHYVYPDVMASEPLGCLIDMCNSPLFRAPEPFELAPDRARYFGQQALSFRHLVSFNAQHLVVRRSYVDTCGWKPFYQSPYPDYFSCFAVFLSAPRIVVMPKALVIIGIARQSFGFFFFSDAAEDGFREFAAPPVDEQVLSGGDAEVLGTLRFPGSQHLRNWLVAALLATRAVTNEGKASVDLRRYRRIQALDVCKRAAFDRTLNSGALWRSLRAAGGLETGFVRRLLRLFGVLRRFGDHSGSALVADRVASSSNIYYPADRRVLAIGSHETICDAVDWLAERRAAPPPPSTALPRPVPQAEAVAELRRRALVWYRVRAETEAAALRRMADAARAVSSRLADQDGGGTPLVRQFTRLLRRTVSPGSSHRCTARTIRDSGLFDEGYYLASNPDVAASGQDPLAHYILHGAAEGREPGPLFDGAAYLSLNPDVRDAGANPLFHYLTAGRQEGRRLPTKLDRLRSLLTEPTNEADAVEVISDSGLFAWAFYADGDPQFGEDERERIAHYIRHGAAEGRDPHPAFSTQSYLKFNPDVARAGRNPLVHFLLHGAAEGRVWW